MPFTPPFPSANNIETSFASFVTAQFGKIDPEFVDETMLEIMQVLIRAKRRKCNNSFIFYCIKKCLNFVKVRFLLESSAVTVFYFYL